MDTLYTFDTERNSYFAGHDLRVRWDDRSLSILVNAKEGMLAVNVKDNDTFHNLPLQAQAAAKKIGDEATQVIYERSQRDFWDWAGTACKDHGFETVYQEGRTGGWLAVAGTEHLDGRDLIEPDEDEQDIRDRFLAFAFEVEMAIENEGGYKQQFYAALVEAGEAYREPVGCPNCGKEVDPSSPAHDTGCVLGGLLGVMADRGEIDFTKVDVSTIDADALWSQLGPIVDDLEGELTDQGAIAELADEFAENGLSDVAEHLREHGTEATVQWLDGQIADARENDDPEGWRLGNLEVAKDRLAERKTD